MDKHSEKEISSQPVKPKVEEHASTVDVMQEFAHSVYNGAIGDFTKYFSHQPQAPEDNGLHSSMKAAETAGRRTGEFLDVVALSALAHFGLKSAGVIGRQAEKLPSAAHALTTEADVFHQAAKVETPVTGHLEFKAHSTILTNEHGTFERNNTTGAFLHTAPNGDSYGFPVNGKFSMGVPGDEKPMLGGDHYFVKRKDGSEIVFNGLDEARYATAGKAPQTQQWSFDLRDGSISMRTDGGGTHTLDIGPDGKGEAVSWGGPSGMDRLGIPVVHNPETRAAGPYVVPDRTPISSETREQIEKARSILEQATLNNASK